MALDAAEVETLWLIANDESDPSAWLADSLRRPEWHSEAACRSHGPGAFIIGKGANAATMDRARAVCSRCTVTEECLAFALADPYAMGVWGGTTGRQRRAMRTG